MSNPGLNHDLIESSLKTGLSLGSDHPPIIITLNTVPAHNTNSLCLKKSKPIPSIPYQALNSWCKSPLSTVQRAEWKKVEAIKKRHIITEKRQLDPASYLPSAHKTNPGYGPRPPQTSNTHFESTPEHQKNSKEAYQNLTVEQWDPTASNSMLRLLSPEKQAAYCTYLMCWYHQR